MMKKANLHVIIKVEVEEKEQDQSTELISQWTSKLPCEFYFPEKAGPTCTVLHFFPVSLKS